MARKRGRRMYDSPIIHDDIIECEILSRLPVKTLMRFKSVCKRWCSLIQHDREFCELHLTRSETCQGRRLLYLMPLKGNIRMRFSGLQECLLSVDLFKGRRAVVVDGTINKTESLVFSRILKPVNGLICFVDDDSYGVRVYNPSTRQITPLIKSTIIEKKHRLKKAHRYDRTYEFGFDPATKEHKVICIWTGDLNKRKPHVACEILTVGHTKWRRIDDHKVPSYNIKYSSAVYVNGSIYWSNKTYLGELEVLWYTKDRREVIIAFDIGSEKFRVIRVPNFIRNQPCDCKRYCGPHVDILEFAGHVALLRRVDCYTVTFWIFDDDDHKYHDLNKEKTITITPIEKQKKKKSITTTISSNEENWTRVTATLPFCWDENVARIFFHSVAGTNHLILRSIEARFDRVSLHSYNWKKQTFKKVKISGLSSICDPCNDISLFTPFVESLLPVCTSATPTLTLQLESEPACSIQELTSPDSGVVCYD